MFREGRVQECFDTFDAVTLITNGEFHVRHLLDFYRTAIELQMAINRSDTFQTIFLICRRRLGEASLKLQKLKALQYYDVDTALHTLLGEVEVNILQGDAEEVALISFSAI